MCHVWLHYRRCSVEIGGVIADAEIFGNETETFDRCCRKITDFAGLLTADRFESACIMGGKCSVAYELKETGQRLLTSAFNADAGWGYQSYLV